MMMRFVKMAGWLTVALLLAPNAWADQEKRHQEDQHGDFVLLGNTLARDCNNTVPAPTVGTVGDCGAQFADTGSTDVYWRSDDPADGQARADVDIAPGQARSTAVLVLPAGATVTYARLYWSTILTSPGTADTTATLDRPGTAPRTITADVTFPMITHPDRDGNHDWFQCTADITSVVQGMGPGAYRVGGIEGYDFRNKDNSSGYAAWAMVVFYRDPAQPLRNLTLFDGFDFVRANPTPQEVNTTITGFQVPNAGFDAKVGVVVYEGDQSIQGDSFLFNGQKLQDDATGGDQDNFFNGSRFHLGAELTVAGDLPQFTGSVNTYSGLDLDVMDVTSLLDAGDTSATIRATTNGDGYALGLVVTSISTFKPEFSSTNKTMAKVGTPPIRPGDTVEYTIDAVNSGNDAAVDVVIRDPLPTQVNFVPGSLLLDNVAQTDAVGDDQAEYDATNRMVWARIGTGANATQGGRVAVGERHILKFRVTIAMNGSGVILNQAFVEASGEKGAPEQVFPSDGNRTTGGPQPTETPVDACQSNADCSAPTPICNTSASPKRCVECITNAECATAASPFCNSAGRCAGCEGAQCNEDPDGDGLTNREEETAGTNPNNPDSDGDGLKDGIEVKGDNPTNPLDNDTDNDGILDGVEDADHDGKLDPAETDPNRADTDGDGMTDMVESDDGLPVDTDGDGSPDARDLDSDADGKADSVELTDDDDGDGLPNFRDPDDDDGPNADPDGDGLTNDVERTLGTNPRRADTDGDGLNDREEVAGGTPGVYDPGVDTNPTDADTDDGGVNDGDERQRGTNPLNPADDGTADTDADGDGLTDEQERTLGTNPNLADTDGDGLTDGDEVSGGTPGVYNPGTDTDPLDADTDDGGVNDGDERRRGTNPLNGEDDVFVDTDRDNDGLTDSQERTLGTDPNRWDTDGDGLGDGQEVSHGTPGVYDPGVDTNPTDADTDDGGVNDGREVNRGTNPLDGRDDGGSQTDSDGDGLTDEQERTLGTNPDLADTDGDGLGDGVEVSGGTRGVYDPGVDTDPLDADTDNGGVNDGDERQNGTNPLNPVDDHGVDPDRDGDGLTDSQERALGTDPERWDTDGDGLGDGQEVSHGTPGVYDPAVDTDPTDADTDDGGVNDGVEVNRGTNPLDGRDDGTAQVDTDGDGLTDDQERTLGTNPHDPDTDGDGLNDGTEVHGGTPGVYDRGVDTDPLDADTDDGGVGDGAEVRNRTNPLDGTDDHGTEQDTDDDGLTDEEERKLGTDPDRPDTDGDGLNDGQEVHGGTPGVYDPGVDTDPTKRDTDGGGVDDGTERRSGTNPLDPSDDDEAHGSSSGGGTVDKVENEEFVDEDGDGYADNVTVSGGCSGCSSSMPVDAWPLVALVWWMAWRQGRRREVC